MSNRKQLLTLLAIVFVGMFASGFIEKDTKHDLTLFVPGCIMDSHGRHPCYVQNDSIVLLKNIKGYVYSMFVDDSNVYLAGSVIVKNKTLPAIIKNGVPNILSDSSGTLCDIKIVNGDTYAAGYLNFKDKYGDMFPVIWKNGIPIFLSNQFGVAFSILVAGNDVYIGGSLEDTNSEKGNEGHGQDNPVIWKNDSIIYRGEGVGDVFSILFSDGHLYAPFYEENKITGRKAVLFTDNKKTILPNRSKGGLLGISKCNNNVYVWETSIEDSEANAWINGSIDTKVLPAYLPDGDMEASMVIKGKYYAVELKDDGSVCIWNDGKKHLLPNTNQEFRFQYSKIFIK